MSEITRKMKVLNDVKEKNLGTRARALMLGHPRLRTLQVPHRRGVSGVRGLFRLLETE